MQFCFADAAQHARGLETFGRLLAQQPGLTASMVAAALDIMASIPLEAPGQVGHASTDSLALA